MPRTLAWLHAVAAVAFALGAPPSHGDEAVDADAAIAADPHREASIERVRASGDLRLRILFSQRMSGTPNAIRFDDVEPLAALVDAARGSTDPLTLQLLLERCRDRNARERSCDAIDVARRWVAAETQNIVAWIELATILASAGDQEGADAAWRGAGRASTMRDADTDVTRLVVGIYPAAADPIQRLEDLMSVRGIAVAVPMRWYQDVAQGCKAASRRAVCAHIASVTFRDASTLLTMQISVALTERAGEPAWLVRSRRQTIDALMWALSPAGRGYGIDLAAERPDELAAARRAIERSFADGEVRWARDRLTALRVPESEAALRYAARERG